MKRDYKKYLNERIYQADLEGDDLPLEYAKQIITDFLEQALEIGVKKYMSGGEIPDEFAGELVQKRLEELIPKLQNFVAAGAIPVK